MSAMTEARLNLIADDISICGANVALHHSKELISEVLRLRECIAEAPCNCPETIIDTPCSDEFHTHTHDCYIWEVVTHDKDCWKREALGDSQ